MSTRSTVFNTKLLEMADYKDWLLEAPSCKTSFICSLCDKTRPLELSNSGVAALMKHMDKKKHKDQAKVIHYFILKQT